MNQTTIFKWPIENFSKIVGSTDPKFHIMSKAFNLEDSKNLFYLIFLPVNKMKGYSTIYLRARKLTNGVIKLEFRIWLENNTGQAVVPNRNHTTCLFKSKKRGKAIAFSNEQFLNNDFIKDLIKDDFVFVCCEIRHLPSEEENKQKILNKWQEDREKVFELYLKGIVGSVTIETEDGHKFNVAKNVLMIQSDVFYKMLTTGMIEAKINLIKIKGVHPTVMSAFIDFLHVQDLDHLNGVDLLAQDLFELAEKYEVKKLSKYCVKSMEKTMDASNSFERLQLAFMHCNDELKKTMLDYVSDIKNEANFRQIMKTEAWKELRQANDKLAQEIMDAVFDQTKWLC